MPRTSNTVLKRQARKMVFDVYTYMKSVHSKENEAEILKRTAKATQTSVSTVGRIITHFNECATLTSIRPSGKSKPRNSSRLPKNKLGGLDCFDKYAIKRCIHNFHITENESPTLDKLRKKLQAEIDFKDSDRTLRRIIKDLSFVWKKTKSNNTILLERNNIRLMRIEYLEKIKKYREEGRTIVYTDELYVECNSSQYLWTDAFHRELKKPTNSIQRAVIVYAGCEAGFIPNSLCILNSGTKSENELNFASYEKWMCHQLLPNLPPNSVVVFDYASYHNQLSDPAPTSNAKIAIMKKWLTEKYIPYSEDMLKPQLYNLIRVNKNMYKKYLIDEILAEHNHTVLRLPLNHPDLNAMQMAWTDIKDYVTSRSSVFDTHELTYLVNEKVSTMNATDWVPYCHKMQEIETDYLKSDRIIDSITEQHIICADEDSSDSDDESESENDVEDTGYVEEPEPKLEVKTEPASAKYKIYFLPVLIPE